MRVDALQKRLQALSEDQKKKLLMSLHKSVSKTEELTYPCTCAQERFLFQHQLEPNIGVCNIPVCIHIEGNVSIPILQDAINQVIKRHDPLRTYFLEEGLRQVVLPAGEIVLNQFDLSHLEDEKKNVHLQVLAKETIDRRFSINQAPLMRASLLKQRSDQFMLVLAIHHAVIDGWSLKIFLKELMRNYHVGINHMSFEHEPLLFTYKDYVESLRSQSLINQHELQMAYWVKKLHDLPSQLLLPTRFPRPLKRTCYGKTKNYKLSQEVKHALFSICRVHSISQFMTLSTVLTLLLSRYTNMTDIVIGSPYGGRGSVEAEKLIGLFQNMLVFRNNCEGDPTFLEMVSRVKMTTLEAYNHAELPFEKIVQKLSPKREGGFTPIFQVVLSHNNAPQGQKQFAGLTFSPHLVEVNRVDCDLTFMYSLEGHLITSIRIEYSTDLFSEEEADQMCHHLQRIALQCAKDSSIRLSELQLLDREEQLLLKHKYCQGEEVCPNELCMHCRFEKAARDFPNQVAVIQDAREVTYHELDQKSSQLASKIFTKTSGNNDVIPIVMDQSIEMIISMYAILKAGCAYAIVDPQNPVKRIGHIFRDIEPKICLISQKHLLKLPHFVEHTLIFEEMKFEAQFERTPHQNDLNRLAYVLYTSGTTGKPKGVKIQHKAINNTLDYLIRKYSFSESDRILSVSPPYFDISIIDLFGVLGVGGTVVLAGVGNNLEVFCWLDLVRKHRITIWNSVPALMELFVRDAELKMDPNSLATLRMVIMGGDRIPTTLPDKIRSLKGDPLQIVECGGPTECAVFSSMYEIKEVPQHWTSIPYGKPIQNTEIYVLDDHHRLVPTGIEGNLYVSGEGLSAGYLNNALATKEKFFSNPFSEKYPLMYQTGDRGRYFADGNIEFRGRSDFQVKINGVRCELGEISAVLELHPNIAQAAVIQRSQGKNETEIVAFIVLTSAKIDRHKDYMAYLKDRLPLNFMPKRLITLESLPLSQNGKLDRAQLAEMAAGATFNPMCLKVIPWLYEPYWEKKPLTRHIKTPPELFIIFQDVCQVGEKLKKALENRKKSVVSISQGKSFYQKNENTYSINPHDIKEYLQVFGKLDLNPHRLISIVMCWPLNTKMTQEYSMNEKNNFTHILTAYQALTRTLSPCARYQMHFLSSQQFQVSKEVDIEPAHALLEGPLNVFSQEHQQLTCKCIDIGTFGQDDTLISDTLINEIMCTNQEKAVAYRGANRYVRKIKNCAQPFVQHVHLQKDGVYLIVGGLGMVGLTIAQYLTDQVSCKIGIMTRSKFPKKSEWETILHNASHRFHHLIKAFIDFEKNESEVIVFTGDVTKIQDVQQCRKNLIDRYGAVKGVIHSGGVIRTGLAETLPLEEVSHILAPKTIGSENLIHVFSKDSLDFLYLFSSLASVSGYIGGVAYSAANAYQDALAWKHRQIPVRSISWSPWKDGQRNQQEGAIPKAYLIDREEGVTSEEGRAIFDYALKLGKTHLIVSKIPIEQVLSHTMPMQNMERFLALENERATCACEKEKRHQFPEKDLNKIKEKLTNIWKILLKHERFKVSDSFFEVGGHSILATQLISRINTNFGSHFKLHLIFDSPTIIQLAEAILKDKNV